MTEEQYTQMLRMNIATLTTQTGKFDEIVKWGLTSDKKHMLNYFMIIHPQT